MFGLKVHFRVQIYGTSPVFFIDFQFINRMLADIDQLASPGVPQLATTFV